MLNKRGGILIRDYELNVPMNQIIDLIRDFFYKIGHQEHQIVPRDTMVINLEEDIEESLSGMLLSTNNSNNILEHIDNYYPELSNIVRNDIEKLNFLNGKYFQIISYVSQCLNPMADMLANEGFYVSGVEKFNVDQQNTFFILTGEK